MLSIHLKDQVFFAHHGLYPQEKLLGNVFVVNLHVNYEVRTEVVTQLEDTLNYELLFALVKERMAQPTELLETIAMEICRSVMERFEQATAVFISIEKKNPPIEGMQGGVVVSYQLESR